MTATRRILVITSGPLSRNPSPWKEALTLSAAGAFVFAVLLAAGTYREGRWLTFDGYYYCELAKQFSTGWPDRFGNHWPFGYPLAGALLARLGLPAYESLVVISCVALFLLLALAAHILATHPLRWMALAAFAAAPIVTTQLFGILTELPFATTLLGLALCLSRWPARGALWGAAACVVLALAVRYAGVIAFAVLGAWTIFCWSELRAAGRRREAVVAGLLALAVAGALLTLNVLKSGHASGASRGDAPGLGALPAELADFGWSVPPALIAGGVRDLVGAGGTFGRMIGGMIFGAIAGLCVWAWLRPRSPFSRPLALSAFGYAAGMAVLHCVGDFDPLYNARTFLPALVPLGLLVVERLDHRRFWIGLGCGAVVVAGVVASVRGVSREIGGDVRAAVAPLRARLLPRDTVAINDHAFSLSAYLPQRTSRVWAEYWRDDFPERFVLVSGEPLNRSGSEADLPAAWTQLCAHLVASGRYGYVMESPALILLEKKPAAP
jgi:hypothetical protein